MIKVRAKRLVTTSRELGLGITQLQETRMYVDVHFLGGKLHHHLERWMLPQRHTNAEGVLDYEVLVQPDYILWPDCWTMKIQD